MLGLKNVVVVIDPYVESDALLAKVRQLARFESFDIHLLSADYTQYLVEGYYFDGVELQRLRQEYLDERKEALEALAEPMRELGLKVTTSAHWGHPAYQVVVEQVKLHEADLVVQGTRKHSLVSRVFLSHDDWQLIKRCPAPLLIVRDEQWPETPRLLCAVDPFHRRSKPSGLDHHIVGVGERIREVVNGELFVMHSWHQPPLSGTYPADAEKQHRAALNALGADFSIDDAHLVLRADPPEIAMQRVQRELAIDLVVMGAVSRSFMVDVFIGNTAERVLDYIESDVLIIKPAALLAEQAAA